MHGFVNREYVLPLIPPGIGINMWISHNVSCLSKGQKKKPNTLENASFMYVPCKSCLPTFHTHLFTHTFIYSHDDIRNATTFDWSACQCACFILFFYFFSYSKCSYSNTLNVARSFSMSIVGFYIVWRQFCCNQYKNIYSWARLTMEYTIKQYYLQVPTLTCCTNLY